jgi:uncharacterized membrane protein YkoI
MKQLQPAALGIVFAVLLIAATACGDGDVAGARDRERGGAEQAQHAQQATVTPHQAQAAAPAAVPGVVQRTRLERDNGTLVYDVTVAPQGGGATTDVEVDAAAGTVLKTQAVGERQDREGDEVDDD